jgi:hypothetical protein
MALRTGLTEAFGIEHPIISAPMAFAAGGKLRPAGDLLREIADDAEGLLYRSAPRLAAKS